MQLGIIHGIYRGRSATPLGPPEPDGGIEATVQCPGYDGQWHAQVVYLTVYQYVHVLPDCEYDERKGTFHDEHDLSAAGLHRRD